MSDPKTLHQCHRCLAEDPSNEPSLGYNSTTGRLMIIAYFCEECILLKDHFYFMKLKGLSK